MGEFVQQGEDIVYRQVDGEITARLTGFEEKMELAHQGSLKFKKILYLLVSAGLLYLVGVFLFY